MGSKKKEEVYSSVDQIFDKEAFLESIENGFREVTDPRVADNQSYPFITILVMIVCAILAGANTIIDIHSYSQVKIEMFKRLLGVKCAPSYNVFWWILTRMNPRQVEHCFVQWIQALPKDDIEQLISIDGKELRGASRRGPKIHLVSAWDSNRSLVLGQVKTQEKSNEITAIPELLRGLDLQGATVTIDAAGCQKRIVAEIREGKGNYMIALKGNQETLKDEAENFFTQARNVDYEGTECKRESSCEKDHGRTDEREIVVTNQLDWLECRSLWKDLKSLIEVTSRRTVKGETTEAKRFYISNLDLSPGRAGQIIRSHWSIENHLHWNMDVNFREDASLASVGNAAENLGALKRLASTLIRMDLGGIRGTAERRRQAAWDDSWTLRLLSRIFEVKM